jgi:hypothetical protein
MFSLIAVLFIVLAMKIYPILCFVLQFSQFYIQDNEPPSTLAGKPKSLTISDKINILAQVDAHIGTC